MSTNVLLHVIGPGTRSNHDVRVALLGTCCSLLRSTSPPAFASERGAVAPLVIAQVLHDGGGHAPYRSL